jgi:hypothetical protein
MVRAKPNLKSHGSKWGPGKVHYALDNYGYTPHGYVYGEPTDEEIDCKKCLEHFGMYERPRRQRGDS